MSKGTFTTPRSLGSVEEIQLTTIRYHRNSDGSYQIEASFREGNDVGGTFEVIEQSELNLSDADLTAADQVFVDNFLKVILTHYIGSKGYSNITIS